MSRLSRVLVFATAVAAVGWMAIVGDSNRVAGQNAPRAEEGSQAAQKAQAASVDDVDERQAVESAPEGPETGRSDGANAWAAVGAAVRRRESDREIEAALAKRVSFNFKQKQLRHVLSELARSGSFPLWIDERALEDIRASADDVLTGQLDGVTIRQALDRVLSGRGLTWLIHDEILRITTYEEAEQVWTTQVYDVGPLLDYAERHAEQPRDDVLLGKQFSQRPWDVWPYKFAPEDWVVEIAEAFTPGPWQVIDGTGGSVTSLPETLVVRQTDRVQSELASLLDALVAATRGDLKHGSREVRHARYPVEADRQIHAALERKVSLDFQEMPLKSAAAEIAQRMNATIIIDDKALQDNDVGDPLIQLNVENVTWRSAIDLLLKPHGLTAVVQDGAVQFTSPDEAAAHLFTTVYDVRDLADRRFGGERLVNPVQNETSGPWEEIDGNGGAAAIPVHGILLVRQTQRVHDEIAMLLADLREHALKPEPPAAPKPVEDQDPNAVVTRFYPIDPLLATAVAHESAGEDPPAVRRGRPTRTALERTIKEFVAPDTWRDAGHGGTGVLEKVNDVLVVDQTAAVHRELRDFLDRLENAAAVAAAPQGLQLQGFSGGLGSGGIGGGFGGGAGGGFFRLPVPEQAPR